MTRKIVATIRLIRPSFGATQRDKTLQEKHETFMRSMVANPEPPASNPHRLPIVRRGRKTIAAYTGMQLAVGDFVYSGHTFEVCVCSGATRLNLPPGEWATVVDLAYGDTETPLVAQARKRGVRTIDGLEVLVRQGALSFERWTGVAAPLDDMRAAVRG